MGKTKAAKSVPGEKESRTRLKDAPGGMGLLYFSG